MKWSKNDFTGTGKVFSFTLFQQLKSKANMVSLVIMLLLIAASVPVMALFMGDSGQSVTSSNLERVYLCNETGYEIDVERIRTEDLSFAETEFLSDESRHPDVLGEGEAAVTITEDASGYQILLSFGALKEVSKEEQTRLQKAVEQAFMIARYQSLGIFEEDYALLSSPFDTRVETVSDYLEREDYDFESQFWVQYVYSILVMTISLFSSIYIIRIVVEEKSSKLIEMLMVSIKPLALITGKILAVMVYLFGTFVSWVAVYFISYGVTGLFMDVSGIKDTIFSSGAFSSLTHIDPFLIPVVLISLLLGYLTFSILSGIFGTACSSMDEVEGANTSVTFFVLGAYLVTCFIPAFPEQWLSVFSSLCPVLSIFCAPVQYVLGNIGLPLLLLSWLIQAGVVFFLARLCGKIYYDLLMYRGSRLKLINILALARRKEASK